MNEWMDGCMKDKHIERTKRNQSQHRGVSLSAPYIDKWRLNKAIALYFLLYWYIWHLAPRPHSSVQKGHNDVRAEFGDQIVSAAAGKASGRRWRPAACREAPPPQHQTVPWNPAQSSAATTTGERSLPLRLLICLFFCVCLSLCLSVCLSDCPYVLLRAERNNLLSIKQSIIWTTGTLASLFSVAKFTQTTL